MFTLNCKGRILVVDKPQVMGIINVTPDSFYSGSRKTAMQEIVMQAGQMLEEGAAILDIGGQSTRPGSDLVTAKEEINRVVPAIEAILKNFPEAIISVDTYYADVAREAIASGAAIVNDISAGSLDPELLQVVAEAQVPYVLMHIKGTPATMQAQAQYKDVTLEVMDFFIDKIRALQQLGIQDIILDPGFGFAKTIGHNFELFNKLEVFQVFPYPLLAGISRKATIYKTLQITNDEALNGTTVMHSIALMKGASFLRVHDVKAAVEAIMLYSAMVDAGAK